MNNRPHSRRPILIVALLITLLIAAGWMIRFGNTSPIQEPTLPPDQVSIAQLQNMLETPVDPQTHQSLVEKLDMAIRAATQRSIQSPSNLPTPELIPLEDPSLPSGLVEGGTSDFHAWEAKIQNMWLGYVNNQEHVVIYAGELGSETDYPGRGVVFVLRRTPDKRARTMNQYLLPAGTGSVRISEVKGDYLVLTSNDGETFYFDIPGQGLVSSLDESLPTVTPMPTATPWMDTANP